MAPRHKTDKELTEKFRRLYGKQPTVDEFLQFKKHYAPFDPYKEESQIDDRKQIPILETEDDDSVFLDD